MNRFALYFCAIVVIAIASSASADYQTLNFDITKNDSQAYATDIPTDAFTPTGLKLPMSKGVTHTLTSNKIFSDEFDYDLQIEIKDRGVKGDIFVDVVLVNDDAKRKVVGTYVNHAPEKGADTSQFRYLKDGKPMVWHGNGGQVDFSLGSAVQGAGSAPFEWLRIHKAITKVWFMQRLAGQPFRWDSVAEHPPTDFFEEDCESFKLGFVVRGSDDATGTVLIKTMRVAGGAVLPHDPAHREFHFDFGPVNQEVETDFQPANEYTMYTPAKGFGWIIPEPEKIWRGAVPMLGNKEIAEAGFPSITGQEYWGTNFVREAYWMEHNDKKLFYSSGHGWDYIEFYKKYLDLATPLERDFVGMAKPAQFWMNSLYQKDVEERRGSLYLDDDLSADFIVDLPNGNYNVILGAGYSQDLLGGGEAPAMNLEINGRVRKQAYGPNWRRCCQYPVRNILVENGKMDFRFFVDVRKCMNPFGNHRLAVGWMVNYLLILPAEQKELMNEWEWKIIKRRGEVIRRVTFVEGDPAVTHLENKPVETAAPFISLNGKPFYFCKLQNNYVPGDTDHVSYYCLANTIYGTTSVKGSQHFFKPDWEKLSYSDDYPWDMVDRMNVGYTWHCLTSLALEDIISFVPQAVQGEGTPTMDSRGRSNRYNIQPPLNSALGKEIQKEAYTMMANQLGLHPAKSANYIYEELWHPEEQGYDDQSLIQYWDWLKRKYPTIDALNKEWGSSYKDFDDIVQPTEGKKDFWQFTPEYVNFRKFRAWAQEQTIRTAVDLAHNLEPDHMTWGAKGDFGTQSYYPGEFLDMYGWYSPEVAASVARHFHKACIIGGYSFNCEHAYLDGRKQFDHAPGPRRYLGRYEVNAVYNRMICSIFKGTKGFYSEWYSDGLSHYFHRTEMIKAAAAKFQIKHWSGQLAFFDPEAFEGPPVNMERTALYASCANKMLYRLAPLWLPAKPLEPKVLFPLADTSFFLDFIGARPFADFESVQKRVLRSSNVPADFLNIAALSDLSKYKLIVLGDVCQTLPKADADRIRQFVLNGGKLIILNGGAFTHDERPRRYHKGDVYPIEEFADLGGYNVVCHDGWHPPLGRVKAQFVKTDIAPDIADGQALGEWDTQFYYEPKEGSHVFLSGTLNGQGYKDKQVALGILNKAGNVAIVSTPPQPKDNADDSIRPLSRWFRQLLNSWNIDDRVRFAGVDDEWDLYSGMLTGDGYYLAVACNESIDKSRKLSLKLSLPPGDYTVEDVTGDPPEIIKKSDGGNQLKENPSNRRTKIDYTLSARQLADGGIATEIPPLQARLYLIRPATQKVWVSIWKPSLSAIASKPITIAYGTSPQDKAGADAIATALKKAGAHATLLPAAEVKRQKLHYEVRVKPDGSGVAYHEDRSKWYLMDTFDNEVIDTDNNFIVVGSEETNELLNHLGKPGTFVYDKVLEKISGSFPGPARGLIGMVESINAATYDPRSQSRDALTVGGSDAAGTTAAVNELVELIATYGKQTAKPTTAPAHHDPGATLSRATTMPAP